MRHLALVAALLARQQRVAAFQRGAFPTPRSQRVAALRRAAVDKPIAAVDAPAAVSAGSYQRGLITIGSITVVFASNSPVLHAAASGAAAPPVLLLNAACAVLALAGLLLAGPLLAPLAPTAAAAARGEGRGDDGLAWRAGSELGLWKFLGATANLYGLSLTSADHGAFLIQLTTLIVPLVQGARGVPIPRRIWVAVAAALAGVLLFTRDPAAAATAASNAGDGLCVLAAVFYATYDLRLFEWGKVVAPVELITTKIATQAGFSVAAAAACSGTFAPQLAAFSERATTPELLLPLAAAALWSGLVVNAFASILQVSGQQAVGPARAQVVYASQPLWAAILSLVFLGETVGAEGAIGGGLFLFAVFLAATAPDPDPNCAADTCEV